MSLIDAVAATAAAAADDDDDDDDVNLCYTRMMYVQGDNNKDTEAWFNALNKAMQVDRHLR